MEDITTRKSNFVYNYCLEENNEISKPTDKINELFRRNNGKYLKLGNQEQTSQNI